MIYADPTGLWMGKVIFRHLGLPGGVRTLRREVGAFKVRWATALASGLNENELRALAEKSIRMAARLSGQKRQAEHDGGKDINPGAVWMQWSKQALQTAVTEMAKRKKSTRPAEPET